MPTVDTLRAGCAPSDQPQAAPRRRPVRASDPITFTPDVLAYYLPGAVRLAEAALRRNETCATELVVAVTTQ